MTVLGDARRHFWLTIGMSRRLGVDLNEAIRDDVLTTMEYTDLVNRCRGCAWADGCESWQAAHPGAVSEVPENCVNTEMWKRLRVV